MYGQSLIDSVGDEINGKVIGTLPGTEGEGADKFEAVAEAAGMDPTGTYVPESYDAAALIALAIAAAGGPDRAAHPGPDHERGQRAGRADLRRASSPRGSSSPPPAPTSTTRAPPASS